jgi:diguanylate cyclase (GGDEF)-like protein
MCNKNPVLFVVNIKMHSSKPQGNAIEYQALIDLSARARGGIFIYILLWFITAFWADIPTITPTEFYFNSVCVIVISLLRMSHLLLLKKYARSHTHEMYIILVMMIILVGLFWGLLSCWVMFFSPYEQLKYPYMAILSAVGIGGTTVLSISRAIAYSYPFLIFVPSILMALFIGGGENHTMSCLALLSMAYVVEASRTTRNDYESAVHNRILAEERSQQLKKISTTDELTGLKNRKYYNEQIFLEWQGCRRSKLPISILMYDLDHFKNINDEFGHMLGDDCLRLVASMLAKEVARDTDIVARFGGEEFIIILPNTDIIGATQLAERLVTATRNLSFLVNNQPITIKCSIGVASTIPASKNTHEKLISSADKALYEAKAAGRNRFCIADIADD